MKIIAFEGLDGAGKTTVIPPVATRLRVLAHGRTIVEVGEFGSRLGEILLTNLHNLSPMEKVLWFAADRISIIERLSQETAPDAAAVVLWDRYVASAIAYRQAEAALRMDSARAEGLLQYTRQVNAIFPLPTLYLYLSISPATSKARKASSYSMETLRQVEGAYFGYLQSLAVPLATVDAERSVQEVVDSCVTEIQNRVIMTR